MAKYTIEQLEKKYGNWRAPTVKLFLGGKEVSDPNWHFDSVESETDVSFSSGVCTLTLTGVYDTKNSKFTCEDQFILGIPVVVQLGYVVTSPVFHGFLYSVEYSLGDGPASVTLTCMDVKAAMMGAGFIGSGAETYKKALQNIWAGSMGYAELCKAPNMGSLPELDTPLGFSTARLDHYGVLTETARRFGLECFVDDGELLLRKKPASGSALIVLSGIGFVKNIRAASSTKGYVSAVTVYGGTDDERDGEKKRAKGQAKNSVKLTPGNSSAKRLIGDRTMELFVAGARDEKTAKELAEAQLRLRQEFSSDIVISMQGLPEIKPGYFITLERMSPKTNGDAYITSVSHFFNEDGFSTRLNARKEG